MQIAVSGVAVGDDRDRDALGHAADGVGHLGHGREADVGQAESMLAVVSEAADEDGFEPGQLDEPAVKTSCRRGCE